MTDVQAVESSLPQPDSEDEAANRGTLTGREKVAQRLAVRAALDTPDVVPFSTSLARVAGRSLPQAQLTVTDNRVTAHLKVTVAWPAPAVEVARAVQRNVAQVLSSMAGLHVDRVDVTVEQLSTAPTAVTRTLS